MGAGRTRPTGMTSAWPPRTTPRGGLTDGASAARNLLPKPRRVSRMQSTQRRGRAFRQLSNASSALIQGDDMPVVAISTSPLSVTGFGHPGNRSSFGGHVFDV